ncbi:thiosulfate:glutathione sulfurtransferase [Sceloporus undulatus]|uniref:thiosulfate:glutathione sulfurtransferase n=1 Tax=Sceloporus undulatus TaxID=8520 RepID=UPI001C4C3B4F|nr:thiosulfate:glutathione sulfurtransferase [Sceloporus undulatus]
MKHMGLDFGDGPWQSSQSEAFFLIWAGPGTWVPGMALSGVQTLLQTRVRTQVELIARLKGTPVLCNMEKAKTISYEDLRKLLDQKKVRIFDVRSAEEVAKGRIAHSVHIPVGEVEEAFKMDPEAFKAKYGVEKPQAEEENLVFHCQMGKRGARATEIATALGYAKARNFAGGYQEWSEKGGK